MMSCRTLFVLYMASGTKLLSFLLKHPVLENVDILEEKTFSRKARNQYIQHFFWILKTRISTAFFFRMIGLGIGLVHRIIALSRISSQGIKFHHFGQSFVRHTNILKTVFRLEQFQIERTFFKIETTRHPRFTRGSGSASARLMSHYDGWTAFRMPAWSGHDGGGLFIVILFIMKPS